MAKIAFVTGAGRGMGEAIAFELANKGFAVAVADINEIDAKNTADTIIQNGGEAIALKCDVTNFEEVTAAIEKTHAQFGALHVLVNNAGWDKIEPFIESEPETWDRVIKINYLGPIHTSKAILPYMIEQQYGRIVNIASDAGRVGSMGEAVYSGAKGGIIAFSKTLAREMARNKITVNCVCPGPTNTPLFAEMSNDKLKQSLIRSIPLGRLAEVTDIAKAVAYFSSDDAEFVTGQTISVSGGLTMV